MLKILRLDFVPDANAHRTSPTSLTPQGQLAFRAIALGYCSSILCSNFVFTDSFAFFTFFTNLSYILLTLYFMVVVYLSVRYPNDAEAPSHKTMRAVNVLFELVATNALFLDIVYWTMLYRFSNDKAVLGEYFCFNVHLINLFLILVEVITTKFHFEPRHAFFTTIFVAAYATFAALYYVFDHTWVYPILDWHQPKAPYYYGSIFVLNIFCFFIWCIIHTVREKIVANRKPAYLPIQTPPPNYGTAGSACA